MTRARRIILFSVLLALVVAPVPSALAEEKTVLSGTVISDSRHWHPVFGHREGCELAPDCRVWLESGCLPTLAGRQAGLTASIEDVAELAVQRSRWLFEFGTHRGYTGVAEVQLWRHDCTEIVNRRWRASDCDGDGTGRYCRSTLLRIPSSARWMTITGYPYIPWLSELTSEPLTLNWTLSGPVAH
jgi:hypothetical protein